MIYFVMFVLSTAFCWGAVRCERKRNKKYARVLNAFAILMPAILAGVRHESVGTDVRLYLNNVYALSESSGSFFEYIATMSVMYSNIGVGFSTMVYLVAALFDDVHWVYFFISLIPMAFMYYGVKRNVERSNQCIVWLMLLMLLYNISLNLLRQIIAVSIIYWGHKYIIDRKPLKYFLTCFAAILFHDTSIVFVLFYFIYWFMNGNNSFLRMLLSCAALVVFLFAYQGILQLAVSWGLLDSRFITSAAFSSGFHFGGIVTMTPIIMALYVVGMNSIDTYGRNKRRALNYYSVIAVMNAIFFSIGSATSEAYRIGYYTMVFMPEVLLRINGKFNRASKRIANAVMVILLIYYWYFLFIVNGFAATVPYITDVF